MHNHAFVSCDSPIHLQLLPERRKDGSARTSNCPRHYQLCQLLLHANDCQLQLGHEKVFVLPKVQNLLQPWPVPFIRHPTTDNVLD